MKKLLLSLFASFPILLNAQEKDITTVNNLDLKRYMGKWYEIARFENKFQKGLSSVEANYTLRDDGKVKVVNSGYDSKGELKASEGKAKLPDPNKPGQLKVSFFLWFYADYYVLELDEENYSYSLVSSTNTDFLWILSRTPTMDKEVLDMLVNKAKERGYDTNKLIYTMK